MNYVLIQEDSPARLSSHITRLIREGWKPLGSPQIIASEGAMTTYIQACVKL